MSDLWTLRLGRAGGFSFTVSSISIERSHHKEYAKNNYYKWPNIQGYAKGGLKEETHTNKDYDDTEDSGRNYASIW